MTIKSYNIRWTFYVLVIGTPLFPLSSNGLIKTKSNTINEGRTKYLFLTGTI